MATSGSPAGARRRVRLAVRNAREAKDLTQHQVAEAMEWSVSKVVRIESGEVTISPNDLRPLLAHLGITDRAVVDELMQDVRTSRRRRFWWDETRIREHLTPAMRQLMQYEAEAIAIRHFNSMIIPGGLQIEAYASAILSSYRGQLPDGDIEGRLWARMRRRDDLLARKDRPSIYLLLDESVLKRYVGGARVLGEQLVDLARLVKDSRLIIRVVPFKVEGPLPLFGSFTLMNLAGETTNAVMYRETHLTDEIVEDKGKVAWHRAIFDQLWESALDETISAQMIDDSAKLVLETHEPGVSPRPRRQRPATR